MKKIEPPVVRKERKVRLSKTPYKFVVSEDFVIDDVVAKTYQTDVYIPSTRWEWGHNKKGGYTSKLFLKVKPDNADVVVNALIFEGISIVKAEDHISAKIPRCDWFHHQTDSYRWGYFRRGYKPTETAVELSLLSEDGKILRRDRAANYKSFVKE